MSGERKGVMTPEQEQILDDLIKVPGIGEALDGPAISIIDNQGIDRLLEKATPETKQAIYEVVDILFAGLEQLVEE